MFQFAFEDLESSYQAEKLKLDELMPEGSQPQSDGE